MYLYKTIVSIYERDKSLTRNRCGGLLQVICSKKFAVNIKTNIPIYVSFDYVASIESAAMDPERMFI